MAARLTKIGNCPTCGAPIYGPKAIRAGQFPYVTHACGCRAERERYRRREGDKG